jgi:hypothetical protein
VGFFHVCPRTPKCQWNPRFSLANTPNHEIIKSRGGTVTISRGPGNDQVISGNSRRRLRPYR